MEWFIYLDVFSYLYCVSVVVHRQTFLRWFFLISLALHNWQQFSALVVRFWGFERIRCLFTCLTDYGSYLLWNWKTKHIDWNWNSRFFSNFRWNLMHAQNICCNPRNLQHFRQYWRSFRYFCLGSVIFYHFHYLLHSNFNYIFSFYSIFSFNLSHFRCFHVKRFRYFTV